MTDNRIIEIVDEINEFQNHGDNFVRQPIAINVDLIYYWGTDNVSKFHPYTFFIIKKDNKGIGAVLDMNSDLHWVIKSEYRGQKLMSNALSQVVLPYIFFHLKKSYQEISIDEDELKEINYNASKNLALAVGFHEKSPNKFVYHRKDYDKKDSAINIEHIRFNEGEVKKYEIEIQNTAKTLLKLKAKLEASYTPKEITRYSKTLQLQKMADSLISFRYKFQDIHHDSLMNDTEI